ncbi:MAG: carboxylesterase family protein, partial [Bacteroidales bacterium]|nr:carboxylesterase family protein [Bacteroidales bacterium]
GWGSEPEFDGQEWANKDVVLVTLNYRLGVFGFLTHPELNAESPHGVSGNYGILDQIESLKWVQKNIAQFGGDPENVMIFGQSAGAGSVKTLCESPLTVGLFNKAVIMSGGGMNKVSNAPQVGIPNGALESTAKSSKEILDWAGLTDLKKMRAASTETIYALSTIKGMVDPAPVPAGFAGFRGFGFGPSLTGMPVVDGYVSLRSFDEAALTDNLHHITYMIGYTLNDMGDMSQGIADFCLNREELGDVAYAYEFARPLPDDGSHPEVTARLKGAFHSSDLWFVFKSLKHCWRPWTEGDWDLSEKMLTAWSNFAKTGNPGIDWEPYTKENPNFMVFKLDENDVEASEMGDPIKAPAPAGFGF